MASTTFPKITAGELAGTASIPEGFSGVRWEPLSAECAECVAANYRDYPEPSDEGELITEAFVCALCAEHIEATVAEAAAYRPRSAR